MCSFNVITYNENGNINSSQSIRINDNGIKDFYNKKFIIKDNQEKILLEEGNRNLAQKKTKFFDCLQHHQSLFSLTDTETKKLNENSSNNENLSTDNNLVHADEQ